MKNIVKMRNVIISICLLFIVLSCSTRKQVSTQIPLVADLELQKSGKHIFYLPIKFDGIEKSFKMQFDLGLNVSVIYGNSMNVMIEKFPSLNSKYIKGDEFDIFKSKYTIGNYKSDLDSLYVYPDYGSDERFEEQSNVGSLGVNQFKNKILLINYKKNYIQILDNLHHRDFSKMEFTPMYIENDKIILTLSINNKEIKFLFDTGNSVPILTINRDFYEEQTENQKELRDTIKGNSWGETITIVGAKQQKQIGTKNKKFNIGNNRTYFADANSIKELYKALNVEHSIGNNYFLNETIVFDFKNNRFGILK